MFNFAENWCPSASKSNMGWAAWCGGSVRLVYIIRSGGMQPCRGKITKIGHWELECLKRDYRVLKIIVICLATTVIPKSQIT